MVDGFNSPQLSRMKSGSSMKTNKHHQINHSKRRAGFSAWGAGLAVVLGAYGALGCTAVHAQATTGSVFGSAPAGQTVTVHSTSGTHRHSKANDKGHYTIGSLPMGVYTVALEKDGNAVDTRSNINITVGRGAEVDFACAHDQCAESANN
jgi:hypothetical protein